MKKEKYYKVSESQLLMLILHNLDNQIMDSTDVAVDAEGYKSYFKELCRSKGMSSESSLLDLAREELKAYEEV